MKITTRDVPTGVFILAGLFILGGILYTIIGLFSINIFSIAFGILMIFCGSELSTLKQRGWILAVICSILYLLNGLPKIKPGQNLAFELIDPVISVIILLYLNKPDIKKAFNRKTPIE